MAAHATAARVGGQAQRASNGEVDWSHLPARRWERMVSAAASILCDVMTGARRDAGATEAAGQHGGGPPTPPCDTVPQGRGSCPGVGRGGDGGAAGGAGGDDAADSPTEVGLPEGGEAGGSGDGGSKDGCSDLPTRLSVAVAGAVDCWIMACARRERERRRSAGCAAAGEAAAVPAGTHYLVPADAAELSDGVRAKTAEVREMEARWGGGDVDLSKRLTVVITTSPSKSNPSVEMLRMVVESCHGVPGLKTCPFVVVCDGVRVRDTTVSTTKRPAVEYKAGFVDTRARAEYCEYRRRLRLLCADRTLFPGGARLLILPERSGFAWAVKAALDAAPDTPYHCIIQHDRTFHCGFNLPGLLDHMDKDPGVKVACCKTSSLVDHAVRTASRRKLPPAVREFAEREVLPVEGVRLLPQLAFLDSTHIARQDHYREFILGGGSGRAARLKRGDFIEDKLAHAQVEELRAAGVSSHARHGTWIVDNGTDEVLVRHIDGSHFDAGRPQRIPTCAPAYIRVRWPTSDEVSVAARHLVVCPKADARSACDCSADCCRVVHSAATTDTADPDAPLVSVSLTERGPRLCLIIEHSDEARHGILREAAAICLAAAAGAE